MPDEAGKTALPQSSHQELSLCAQDLEFSYDKNHPLLQRISAEILPGSFLAILGMNGCGKSTFLECLDGVLHAQAGSILLGQKQLADFSREERARHIAFVAQHSHANRLTVYDALLLGRKPYVRTAPTQADYDKVDEIIERMNLEPLALRYVDELSGGEYQKMMIARAFVQDTQVLLLDEPTNNLDIANQIEVLSMVRKEVDTNKLAAVAILHDVNMALRFCDRFLMLKNGKVEAYGGQEIMTAERIKSVYGVEVEILEHAGKKLMVLV